MSKTEPKWFPRDAVLPLHSYLLELFGGSPGLRDEGALDSALTRPLNLFSYGNPSVFELATAYASGIVRNHPFVDGNKRTGLGIALTLLEENGYTTNFDEAEMVQMTLALAARDIEEEVFTKWLQDHSVPREL